MALLMVVKDVNKDLEDQTLKFNLDPESDLTRWVGCSVNDRNPSL